ncbi:MAG: glycerophosphodiester phosphodiesterase family protein [Acutalibacteraceae bacterium]|nr:glycerophosphodiester phosphodiesterase family protein [Acutalibacteraceae bacterium]
MVRFLNKFALLILILTLVFNIFSISVGAVSREDLDSAEKIICIVHRGDWHSFPENSAEAVKAGCEYGFVSVDVKLTKDGKAVLLADDTTDRMVVDADGKTVSGNVADKTYAELASLYLRAENGSEDKAKTDCRVSGLDSALSFVSEDSLLILNTNCEDFEKVYAEVKALGATEKVAFRFLSDSNSDIIKTTSVYDDITVFGNYQGNIIFLATSAVKKSFENGMNVVELGSKNGNGVLYDEFLMDRFDEQGRAMASMVNGRSGKRPDSERGWDDLIRLGYSVIETNYPEQFNEYLEQIEDEEKQLNYYVDLYKSTDLQPYTTDSEKAFSTALDEAKNLLSGKGSLSEMQNARHALQSAYDNLTLGEKKAVTLKFEFTAGRLIAVVLCGGAIIAAQVFFFRKRDKNKKAD